MTKKTEDSTKILSAEAIQAEFELATTGMDFEGEEAQQLRTMFYTYFVAGALWAQGELVSSEVWIPRTVEELAQATTDIIKEKETANADIN